MIPNKPANGESVFRKNGNRICGIRVTQNNGRVTQNTDRSRARRGGKSESQDVSGKRRDNVDTYAYFGEPVYVYSLKEGINDGFLTPFRVKQIATTLDDYVWVPDDTIVEGEIEEGKRYREPQFNRTIEIEQRERYRVKLFMDQIDQREKTLVFCATQGHAALVRDLINQMKTSSDPNYCVRVTADDGAIPAKLRKPSSAFSGTSTRRLLRRLAKKPETIRSAVIGLADFYSAKS